MIDWKTYLIQGLLKKQNPNFVQITRQIQRAQKDLKTFTLIIVSDPEWASTIAYQAMLRIGRALIFSYGYLPADGQQHKTVVDVTGKLLGEDFSFLITYFDRMRRNRNTFFYDSIDADDQAQAKKAFETAAALLTVVNDNILKNNPQFDLNLKKKG
jgi:hypothetical protein